MLGVTQRGPDFGCRGGFTVMSNVGEATTGCIGMFFVHRDWWWGLNKKICRMPEVLRPEFTTWLVKHYVFSPSC